MRGFTVRALITPNALAVETSLAGFAKFGLFSKLKISHRKISFTRSIRGVLLITVSGFFAGTLLAYRQSLSSEPYLILAALLAVYLVLGVLYESLVHPLTIISTLPSASVGALIALMLFKIDLNVISIIGIVLLIGIVKKNAIMMIDFALVEEREYGRSPADAIF